MATRTGSGTYVLPSSADAPETFWSAIWDVGITDVITAENGRSGAMIDLRSATLMNEPGGAGWIFRIGSIQGGFTIANGVVVGNTISSAFDNMV